MKKLQTLGLSLLMILIQCQLVYAESVESSVQSGINILKAGTTIILGFGVIGIGSMLVGMLLDIGNKAKIKLYMELSIYALGVLVVSIFFIAVFYQVQSVASIKW